jgi:hypothetical protein
MSSAAERARAKWHGHGDDESEILDPPLRSRDRERWPGSKRSDSLLDLEIEVAALKVQREIDRRRVEEFADELHAFRSLITPPGDRVPEDVNYSWALAHGDKIREYAGRWIGVNAALGGIVADGARMIEVRNILRDRGRLADSYVIFVPPVATHE